MANSRMNTSFTYETSKYLRSLIVLSGILIPPMIVALLARMGNKWFILFIGFLFAISIFLIGLNRNDVPLYVFIVFLAFGDLLKVDFLGSSLLILPGGLALLAWILGYGRHWKKLRIETRTAVALLFFLFWGFLASIYNDDIMAIRSFVFVVILYFLTLNVINSKKRLIISLWIIVTSLSFVALYVVVLRIPLMLSGVTIQRLHNYPLAVGDKNIIDLIIKKKSNF